MSARAGLYQNLASVAFDAPPPPAIVTEAEVAGVDEEHVNFLLDELDREMQAEMESLQSQREACIFLISIDLTFVTIFNET